jgi:hypothetical protein
MSDYDALKAMFTKAKIDYDEDWNRQVLLGNETRIVKWLSVVSLDERGLAREVQFMFNYDGKLESICPLTEV